MAIAIEGYTVVGLKSRIAEEYAGGVEALSQAVPNATALADDDLWRCSFMASEDVNRFLQLLEQAGLEVRQGPNSDFVVVSECDLSVAPYCEWLEVARWDKGVIAWRTGTSPRKVLARQGWSPEHGSGLQFPSDDDNEHLELLRLDGNVAVYFDKRRGCEVYVGRTQPDTEEVYKLASRVITNHFVSAGEPTLTGDAADKVRAAVADLEPIARENPEAWGVYFFLGKGKLALGDLEGAYQALRRANELETETESLPRELAGLCLELGRPDEAVKVAQTAAAIKPDDFEALSNLAAAYLVAGRHTDASTTIRASLKLKPDDVTSHQLKRMIEAVASGTQPQPHNMSELNRLATAMFASPVSSAPAAAAPSGRQAKPSLWSRLTSWARGK
jgi:tetratricopeptide (TPR) repeat protein